ncbi:MAG: C45 family peptidase [Methylobacteriaceae bacterium]|jgi:hypothetical protein|nr:C45 family peptidase [Methylobacteriaceae bacterium]
MATLSFLKLSGTAFDIGAALGAKAKPVIRRFLLKSESWAHTMAYKDHPFVLNARELTQSMYPRYFREIEGIAEGAGVPLDELFAWHCAGDVWSLETEGCTTVQLSGYPAVIAHNEDGREGLRPGCCLAEVTPDEGRSYTAFFYPGLIGGNAFAVNDAGLVQTVNSITSLSPGRGLPRVILTRALMDCAGTAEAETLIADAPRSGAFHVTLGQAGVPGLISVEFTHRRYSAVPVAGIQSHANHLVHPAMRQEAQTVSASSAARLTRVETLMDTQFFLLGPLGILKDTTNAPLSIFRRQSQNPEDIVTLATANFIISETSVDWRVFSGDKHTQRRSGVVQINPKG